MHPPSLDRSAPPVLLFHSSGGSGAQWRTLAEGLQDRFTLIAVDLYGYGSSPAWSGRERFMLSDEIEHALAQAGPGPFHLVGHSYGGAVALHLARSRPGLACSLALYEPVAFHLLRDGDMADEHGLAEILGVVYAVAQSLSNGDYAGGARHFVEYWNGPAAWDAMPVLRQSDMAARLHKVALDFHACVNEPTGIAELSDVVLPTLLMRGGRSPMASQRVFARLCQAFPHAITEVLPQAGHMAH